MMPQIFLQAQKIYMQEFSGPLAHPRLRRCEANGHLHLYEPMHVPPPREIFPWGGDYLD